MQYLLLVQVKMLGQHHEVLDNNKVQNLIQEVEE